jgi:hypothetical protein
MTGLILLLLGYLLFCRRKIASKAPPSKTLDNIYGIVVIALLLLVVWKC